MPKKNRCVYVQISSMFTKSPHRVVTPESALAQSRDAYINAAQSRNAHINAAQSRDACINASTESRRTGSRRNCNKNAVVIHRIFIIGPKHLFSDYYSRITSSPYLGASSATEASSSAISVFSAGSSMTSSALTLPCIIQSFSP